MSGPIGNSPRDEADLGRDLRDRLRGLDPFIPPAPPFELIERSTIVAAGSPGRSNSWALRSGGLPIGLAVVAVAFVLVLASGFWGPKRGPGVGTSPSSMPSQSAVVPPTASATPAVHPSSGCSIPPAAAACASAGSTQPALTQSLPLGVIFRGSVQGVVWSPGGTELAIIVGGSGEPTTISIVGTDGKVLDTLAAWNLAWIDDSTYVAIAGGDDTNGSGAFVGHVGDTTRQEIPGHFTDLVGGAGGSVALSLNEVGGNHYEIWSRAGLSEPRDGVPVAFSAGGSTLAVVHYPVACCAGAPSPEPTRAPGPPTLDIVSTETGESLARAPIEWAYGAILAFSPSGLRVAFAMYPEASGSRERVGILDIPTQELWVVDPSADDITAFDSLVWTDAGHLSIRSWTRGSIPVDVPVSVSFGPDDGSTIAVSSRGATAIGPKDAGEVTITRSGVSRTLPLPDAANYMIWSPDGSMLLVACGGKPVRPVTIDLVVLLP